MTGNLPPWSLREVELWQKELPRMIEDTRNANLGSKGILLGAILIAFQQTIDLLYKTIAEEQAMSLKLANGLAAQIKYNQSQESLRDALHDIVAETLAHDNTPYTALANIVNIASLALGDQPGAATPLAEGHE